MPDLSLEADFRAQGYDLIAGVDEAGRGPLAGPVAAAAVILPPDLSGNEPWLAVIDDSKRLTERRRFEAAEAIKTHATAWAVAQADAQEIDRVGIARSVILSMLAAVEQLRPQPTALLLDWVSIKECPLPYRAVVKGDAKSLSIAAASILAKVARDAVMIDAERLYPGYGFARHKGYGTALHRRKLEELGASPIHRHSFGALRQARLLQDVPAA